MKKGQVYRKFYKLHRNLLSNNFLSPTIKDLYVLLKTKCVLAQSTKTYKKFYENHNTLASLRKIHWLKKFQ